MNSAPSIDLSGKVVVLTGAAGIYGRGLTADLVALGATLVIASRDMATLERLAASVQAEGGRVHPHPLDLADETSILRLRDFVRERFGAPDGLVNNAVARPMKHADAPLADWEASMKANATGLFAITRSIGALMAARGSGSIVNVSSIQGMVGPDYTLYEGLGMHALPDYFFHKAGMINLTRFFAAQLGPRGVRVNSVSPGGFLAGQPPEFIERYRRATLLGRMADERDLGGPIAFLLSDAARYITGANLPVDGGYTAH